MNHSLLLTLSRSDFRSTFRDPVFRGMLFFPLVAFALVRWGLPAAVGRYPVLEAYTTVILMWACLQSATMFGFVYGFLFLEEKEEQLDQALRVLPVSRLKLTAARLLLGLGISTVINGLMIFAGGVVQVPVWQGLALAVQFSLAAPLIALALGTLAGNRIEGLAQMKIVNLLLMLPGLVYLLPHPALHLLGVVPTYWSFRSLELAAAGEIAFGWYLIGGFLIYGAVVWGLNKMGQRRV